jgi:peptide/nickel transport system permease protein
MRDYLIRRFLIGFFTLWIVSIVVFLLIRVSGDPVYLMVEPGAPMEEIQAMREHWGLDKPLVIQYARMIENALRGDLGKSIVYAQPTLELYLQRLPYSLQLAGTAFVLSFVFGVLMGVLSALRVGGFFDTFGKVFAFLGLAVPSFWLGLMLIMIFAVYLRVLPAAGKGSAQHVILPSIALAWYMTAAYVRITRSSLLEVLGSNFIKLKRITGVPEFLVVAKHALRNAMIPVVTFAGVELAIMVNGGFVVEIVFGWPGTGLLLYDGILQRDYPLVQTVVLITAALVVSANLLVDLLYAYIDPRIRLQ